MHEHFKLKCQPPQLITSFQRKVHIYGLGTKQTNCFLFSSTLTSQLAKIIQGNFICNPRKPTLHYTTYQSLDVINVFVFFFQASILCFHPVILLVTLSLSQEGNAYSLHCISGEAALSFQATYFIVELQKSFSLSTFSSNRGECSVVHKGNWTRLTSMGLTY